MKLSLARYSVEIKKSQTIDAFRLALQSSLSAGITYILMNWFDIPELFLGILSAVLIVEPSVGDTFNQGKSRILSTLVGSAIGFGCVSISPWGAGTTISLVIVMFVMNAMSSFKPDWRYGVVAALAVTLGSENNALDTSVDRVIAILIGVSIGLLVSLIVWPDRASKRAKRYLNKALIAASKRFEIAIENTRTSRNEDSGMVQFHYHKNIDLAERASKGIKLGNKAQVENLIELTKRLYNSIIIIHRVSMHAENDISDGDAGIEKDSEKARELACEITKLIANTQQVDAHKLKELSTLIEVIKSNVQNSAEEKRINVLRYTFVFGLFEIKDSLEALVKTYQEDF